MKRQARTVENVEEAVRVRVYEGSRTSASLKTRERLYSQGVCTIYRMDIDTGIMEQIGTTGVNARQSIYTGRPDLFYRGWHVENLLDIQAGGCYTTE